MKKCTLIFTIIFLSIQSLSAQTVTEWWRYSRLPDGGNISDIATAAGVVYALSSFNSDIFYSANNGQNWQKMPGTQPFWNAISLTVDKPTGKLYVGTGYYGIQWTADKGASWQYEYFYTDPVSGFHALITTIGVKANSSVIVANTPGIFGTSSNAISFDGGTNWDQFNAPYEETNKLKFISSGKLLAATENGVFTSTDNGATWAATNTGIQGRVTTDIAENPSNNHLFAGANWNNVTNDATLCGVFKSVDGGATWVSCNTGIGDTRITAIDADMAGTLYAATPSGMYVSSNDGDSWALTNTGLESYDLTCIATVSNGVYAGSARSGVSYMYNTFVGWSYVNNGLSPTSFRDMTVSSTRNIHILDGNVSGVYSMSAGGNWVHQFNGLPEGFGASIADIGGILYTSVVYGQTKGIYKSIDSGNTWMDITPVIADSVSSARYVKLQVDAANNILYLLASYNYTNDRQKVLSSTDGGMSWSTILETSYTAGFGYNDINISSTGVLYVSSFDVNYADFIPLVSTDHGNTFSPVAINAYVTFPNTYLVLDKHDSLYIVESGLLYRRNGINNWDSLHNGGWGTGNYVYLYFDNNNKMYLSTNYEGIFYSDDGNTFTPLSQGIPTYPDLFDHQTPITLFDLFFDSNNVPYAMGVAAGVPNNVNADTLQGIYTLSPHESTGVREVSKGSFTAQVYPNPVSDRLTVSVSMQRADVVSLSLCDATGRLVKELPAQSVSWGEHKISFLVPGISPGSYFLKINAGSESKIIKLVKE